jgi:predicted membrane channel-forming protein YqfA (hemolysin III family)
MDVHVRIHRWILWWVYVGVACGAVAVINILSRNLSRTQENVILLIGAVFWVLGGVVCYACDAIRVEGSSQQPKNTEPTRALDTPEWHPASDFLFPGHRKGHLPRKY